MRLGRDGNERQAPPSREVNNLLHTLRVEQFRHSQNLRRSKAHLRSCTYNNPSLPFSDIYKYANAPSEERTLPQRLFPVLREGHLEHGYPHSAVPRPKSWTAFRKQALSLVFAHMPWSFGSSDVPLLPTSTRQRDDLDPYPSEGEAERKVAVVPLTQICMRVLLATFPDVAGFRQELLNFLPPMLRRDVLRYTAVHDPLPNRKLYSLFEPEGHVDGEVIVVGPQATLQRDLFPSLSSSLEAREESEDDPEEALAEDERVEPLGSYQVASDPPERDLNAAETEDNVDKGGSWEEESSASQDLPPPLHTLIVHNAQVSSMMLFRFPPTLTRLALLALPSPQVQPGPQIHRLPRMCPLLEVLDLSYNPWLNEPPGGKGLRNMESSLDRIEWEKWARLRVLGLRMCNAPENIATRVNRGRLGEEVDIFGLGEQTLGGSLGAVEEMMKSLDLCN